MNVSAQVITAKAGDKTNCYTYNPYLASWKTTDEITNINPYKIWDRADYNIKATYNMPETQDMYVDFIFIDESSNQLPAYYICSADTELRFVDFPLKDVYLDLGNYVVSPIHTQNYIDRLTWKARSNDEAVIFAYDGHQISASPFIRFIKDDYVYLCKVSPFYNDRIYSNVSYTHNYLPTPKTFTDSSAGHFYNAELGTTIALYPPFTATVDTSTETRIKFYYNETNYRFIPSDTVTTEHPYLADFDATYFDQLEFYTGDRYGNGIHFNYRPALEYMLTSIACFGIYFKYDGVMYLGYMDSTGQTTGERLTADDWETSAQYDSDTVFNFTEHTEPKAPALKDEIDEMRFGYSQGLLGFADTYIMTQNELTALKLWFSSSAPAGLDFTTCVVSLRHAPWAMSKFVANGVTTTITAGKENTGVQSFLCANGKSSVFCGQINVPRIHNNFLDYEPYTTYELYLPNATWIKLPDFVTGKTVNVNLTVDILNASIRYFVTCNNLIIADVAGQLASDIVFIAENAGVKKASQIQSCFSAVSGITSAVAGALTAQPLAIVGGALSASNAISSGIIASNNNYSQSVGNNGDVTSLSGNNTCYLKITTVNEKNPDNYAHVHGRPLNETHTIGSMRGFTVCENVDISGINATDAEKQLIKSMLEAGIYI